MTVWSWGFNSPVFIQNGLQFKVQGFIFQGVVQIRYNEGTDLFDIKLIKNNEVVIPYWNVSTDELIELLDELIEKVDNYKERVKEEYSFINK